MTEQRQPRGSPRIDIHVHLAGVGTEGSGCWISPGFRRRPTFLGIRVLMGIGPRRMRKSADQDWAALISNLVGRSDLDFATVLGFDGVYDEWGHIDRSRSQLIVPMDWVFEVCHRYPNLLPAPSINPYRRDALDRLEEAIERGAVMLKWLPIVQSFDPASPRVEPFLRRVAEAGIPLLVHAGSPEVTFQTVDPTVGGLDRLIPALDAGVKIICAHGAAPIHHSRQPSQIPVLRSLLYKYTNLWVDNSGLANPSRCFHLPTFVSDPLIADRTLHGSDFPVPSSAIFYTRRLGVWTTMTIEAQRNSLQREMVMKRHLGFDEATFRRASSVLANLSRWCPGTHSPGADPA